MHVKHQAKLFICTVILSNMFDFIMCINKRIKIYVPEHIKHVHHHHVKKVPVYIVTKEKPRVLHASHIEDDFADVPFRKFQKTRAHEDYDDDDVLIQGIYKGDESHIHEDVDTKLEYTTPEPQPQAETRRHKSSNVLKSPNHRQKNSYMLQRPGVRYNRMAYGMDGVRSMN